MRLRSGDACRDTAAGENTFGYMFTTWHALNEYMDALVKNARACFENVQLGEEPDWHHVAAFLMRRLNAPESRYEDCGFVRRQV